MKKIVTGPMLFSGVLCCRENVNQLGYFRKICPLNDPDDPPVSELKFQKLLERVRRGPMLLAKFIKPPCPLVFIKTKVKTSTDWGILEILTPSAPSAHW